MTTAFRALYRYWAALLFLAVIVQVGAAGYGAFSADHKASDQNGLTSKQFDHGFGPHIALGYGIFLASLLLVLFALGARPGRRVVLEALTLALLVFVAIAHRAWTGLAKSNP